MSRKDNFRIRSEYSAANCCDPRPGDTITGYHSHDDRIKIHRADCPNLADLPKARLVVLDWKDVLVEDEFTRDDIYDSLDDDDLRMLAFHRRVGVDYSLKVARVLRIDRREAFERHKKLRDLGLLRRVPKVMIQYRKGIVDNKWIKHRNHTYYELTARGRAFADYYMRTNGGGG